MNEPLTEVEKQEWLDKIKQMSQIEMARLWRFAPTGHPIFDNRNQPVYDKFCDRFYKDLGGMTSAISKAIEY